MIFKSFQTSIPDAYRAGIAIGEALESTTPEVILLFCTNDYLPALSDLLEGVREAAGANPLICGCSSDGIYEASGMAHNGVCALAINSEGKGDFKAALVQGVQADSLNAARTAATEAIANLRLPATSAFVVADGCKADGYQLVAGLNLALSVPFFGGLAADDRKFERTVVFLNEEIAEDAVMVLAVGGVPISVSTASGWCPVGDVGRITKADGKILNEIDGASAAAFVKGQTGKTIGRMDLGITALAEFPDNQSDTFTLRSSASTDEETGQVTLFGGVSEGSRVQVCRTSIDHILSGVSEAVAGAKHAGITPKAAIIVSCAGRKWVLTESGAEEVRMAVKELGGIPFVGMPSFGEIGPFQRNAAYSPGMFHNVSFVVALIGE